jgi:S1-C subfamily serine protease
MKTGILEQVKAATVAIATLDISNRDEPFTIVGTGFCIHPRGIVITCEHVLSAFMARPLRDQIAGTANSNEKPESHLANIRALIPHAIFYDSKLSLHQLYAFPIPMDVAISKTNFDLGMIRLQTHPAFKDGFPQLEVGDYSDVHEGMEVWTCGFPLGSYLQKQIGTITSSFTKGIISSIIPSPGTSPEHLKGYQLNLTATHGNSGGPVFSPDTGKVYGVLQLGVSDLSGNIVPGITKAEPIYPAFEHDSLSRILGAPVGKISSQGKGH